MGCCGLTLYATTILAGILTLVDCLLVLPFDILLVTFITVHNGTQITDDTKFQIYINGFGDKNRDFEKQFLTITILLGVKIAFRFVWLISAILLLIGNAREFRRFLTVWKYLTITRVIFAVAITIYAIAAFMDKLKDLFDNKHWTITDANSGQLALFTILIDFLELGPLWLLLFIAFALFVHQRSAEIAANKQRRHVDNIFNSNETNGSVRQNFSSLAHPSSLTQEPNPFIIANENNNNTANQVPKPTVIPSVPKHVTNDSVKPILEINDVICIPRATLKTPSMGKRVQSNVQKFENEQTTSFTHKPQLSALAQRASYLQYERERDANKVPKRNHSYNLAQNSGQRARDHYSYENKAFDYRSEKEIYKPVLVKRASRDSTKRNQYQ